MESTTHFIEVIKRHEPIYDNTHKDYKNMERKANAWLSVSYEVGLSVDACKRKWKNLRDSYTKYLRSYRTGTKTSKKYQYWAHAESMEFLRPFQGPGRSLTSNAFFKYGGLYPDFSFIKSDGSIDLKYELLEKPTLENMQNTDVKQTQIQQQIEQQQKQQQQTQQQQQQQQHQIHHNQINHNRTVTNSSLLPSTSSTLVIDEKNLLKQIELDAASLFFLSLAKSVRLMPKKHQADIKMKCMKIVSDAEMQLEFESECNNLNKRLNKIKNHKHNKRDNRHGTSSILLQQHQHQQQQQQQQQQQEQQQQSTTDSSEHFLYVMSPSRVEAMIDISSSDEEQQE